MVFYISTLRKTYPLAFLIAVCQYIDMICLNCFHEKTKVTNSRPHKKQPIVWRRRQCLSCETIFTSYERPSLDDQYVLDHDNKQSPFSIGKLTISISKSFTHNAHAADYDSFFLAQTVESELITRQKEISTDDIIATTHSVLQKFDPVAALQYAARHDLIMLKRKPGRPSTSYQN